MPSPFAAWMRLLSGARRCWRRSSARLAGGGAMALLALTTACALPLEPVEDWEKRLRANAIALLGEVHDNAEGHARRHAALRRALARGWRPAIVMEQFDTGRQPDIDRARREHPRDAGHLIASAGAAGWDWTLYRPLVQLALDHDLPLLAGNLPRARAMQLVREPAEKVFGSDRAAALGLTGATDPVWQQAQQQAIDAGHCGALPATLLPGMVRAQAARDAVLAERVAGQAQTGGVVLIAGNGHVRRDLGVPRWLERAQRIDPTRVLTVAYLENPADDDSAFDAIVSIAARTDRPDPCTALRQR